MGQAKNRGSKLDRISQSLQKKSDIRPKYLVCNACQSHIADFQELNTKGLHGINAAYAGVCSCGNSTYAISGNKADVTKAALVLQEMFENDVKIGTQKTGKQV